jgi:hypothetical protein
MGFAALYPSYHRMTAQRRTKRRGPMALRSGCGPPYRASTSTSPSTPVITLKLRS